ncbi:MAG TPA: OB-fold nucleic acid binding domain-containing protein [Jiangellaceae bacterium]|nr:OB-fold nucleic acid binding domain-containing protein [Jiangellaceae bacterium]
MGERRRGLWEAVTKWASESESDRDAERLRAEAEEAGYQCLADVGDRQVAAVRGTLQTVTLQPRAGVPALEAELFDGTDVLTLIWLGRRRIGGIDCGRKLIASGRISTVEGRRVMYNPRYQLLPAGVA